jgi:GNAT superfamily N-acetyltransferase
MTRLQKEEQVFRKATAEDIDPIHQLLVAEAEQGRFDRRLVEEPYRSGLRKNLNNIRRKGRRLDQDLPAQLLVWEVDGEPAACMINSAIMGDAGNEIWMSAVLPDRRGQGLGRKIIQDVLACLHPRTDVFSRCSREAEVAYRLKLQLGFLPLDVTPDGVRVLKLPKLGSPAGPQGRHHDLAPFVVVPYPD